MSVPSIAPYFPFCRVKLVRQSVSAQSDMAWIHTEPDNRRRPICHVCGTPTWSVHDRSRRAVRDLDMGSTRVWIGCPIRKIVCSHCQSVRIEDLEFFDPYQHITKRLARYVYDLCKILPVKDVAGHTGLDRKTVKRIDKMFLEQAYAQTDYSDLTILAVDEIAVRKGHSYMTVVLDYLSGRVVWMGKDRTCETLTSFFRGMNDPQKQRLQAIAMDMWDPFIKAVQQEVPHVRIVFDLFHVVSAFNKVIDKVRIDEYRQALSKDKAVFKGSKYLLLKNRAHVRRKKDREQLRKLMKLNRTISALMILKDLLKQIWQYRYRGWANRRINEWQSLALTIDHSDVRRFVRMLDRYRYGILNHCDFPIHTSKLEGVNNKIKVIKRRAYGFHDDRYFSLKVIQAFDPLNGT